MRSVRDDSSNWRTILFERLQERNKKENQSYCELIASYNFKFETIQTFKSENVQLTLKNEKLRQENLDLQDISTTRDGQPSEKSLALEQKLFKVQEELTELHHNSDVEYEPMESDNETIDSYESDDVLSEHEDDSVMLSDSWKRIADIFSDCRPNSLPELVRNFSGINPALNCNANNSILENFKKFITNDVINYLVKNDSKKNLVALMDVPGVFSGRIPGVSERCTHTAKIDKRDVRNAQQLMSLNMTIQEKNKEITVQGIRLEDAESSLTAMKSAKRHLEQTILDLEAQNQVVKDEYQALQLAHTFLESNYKEIQKENKELIKKLLMKKAEDADKLNAENDSNISSKQGAEAKRFVE
ncbi:Autophagy-related protein 16-1 [Nymphon striatum]|nr:Autophagy-related protein 16-1 [Nymphon striatum]